MTDLAAFPEDWQRALAVVAHPDDMEYGAASAVARWTDQGKEVAYVLVTRGEAGISTMPPDEVVKLRAVEQRRSCDIGRRSTCSSSSSIPMASSRKACRCVATSPAAIRRHRPDIVISINFRDSWGGPSWNHADHRAVGRALLDAARDAANPWLFTDAGDPWGGVRFVAFSGSPSPTHAVDVTGTIERGVASLACHELYLEALDQPTDPDTFLRGAARQAGERFGCEYAAAFELIGS